MKRQFQDKQNPRYPSSRVAVSILTDLWYTLSQTVAHFTTMEIL
jgi:hypothetical protein